MSDKRNKLSIGSRKRPILEQKNPPNMNPNELPLLTPHDSISNTNSKYAGWSLYFGEIGNLKKYICWTGILLSIVCLKGKNRENLLSWLKWKPFKREHKKSFFFLFFLIQFCFQKTGQSFTMVCQRKKKCRNLQLKVKLKWMFLIYFPFKYLCLSYSLYSIFNHQLIDVKS